MKKNNTNYTEQNTKTYSDHNVVQMNIDYISSKDVKGKTKVIKRKGYNKYETIIQKMK